MEKLQCENCGATLKSNGFGEYVCEYCGTRYRSFDNIHIIRTEAPRCQKIVTQTEIEDYWVKHEPEKASKLVVENLTASLADTLKDYMTIEESLDPYSCRKIYRGIIRVIPEDYRYV